MRFELVFCLTYGLPGGAGVRLKGHALPQFDPSSGS